MATPIVLSGDVHHGELFRYRCPESSLVVDEITSSGMTHFCANEVPVSVCEFFLDTLLRSKYNIR